jgi:serine/threonine-protein kinase
MISFGRYRLVQPIGQGGMAEVWMAHVIEPGHGERVVALKRIRPDHLAQTDRLAMFRAESRIASRLEHPNIVRVLEAGQVGDEPFFAMEYLHGRDLLAILRTLDDPAPAAFAAHVALEVSSALAYAHTLTDEHGHALGLIHRDVSPANILIDEAGRTRLLDFGVAKAILETTEGGAPTRTGVHKGKRPYMAPEQLLGEPLDARADVFACGVVLHEMLTGRSLFSEANDPQSALAERRQPVPPPSSRRPDVPSALDAVCARALAFDRAARFGSADEMAAALRPIVTEHGWTEARSAALLRARLGPLEPTLPPATNTLGQPQPSAARRWLPFALGGAALVLALLIGLRATGGHRRPAAHSRATPSAALELPEATAPVAASPPTTPSPAPWSAAATDRKRPNTARRPTTSANTAKHDIQGGEVVDPF